MYKFVRKLVNWSGKLATLQITTIDLKMLACSSVVLKNTFTCSIQNHRFPNKRGCIIFGIALKNQSYIEYKDVFKLKSGSVQIVK